jgi:signal transduction histidine kinase
MTSALMLLRENPDEVESILKSAITQSQEAIGDIRRLVYALRPPALDDLGLIAAIGELFTRYRASGITFSIEIPAALPPLPAAVEVACYRIVQEALTNVVRHAHAHTCVVRLTCQEQVTIEIIDDGQGLPPAYRHGVGLASMRERAEELGGRWLIEPAPAGGTWVRAQIPCR